MKKQLLAILFVACLTSVKSQIYFGASFGIGTTGKALAGAATLGVDINHWLLQSGFSTHLSQKAPTLYRLTAGRSICLPTTDKGEEQRVNLTGGFGSLDGYYNKNKELQKQTGTWVISAEYAQTFRNRGEWFLECTQAKKFNFLTVGLKYFFVGGKEKAGCPSTW